jgi:hypothetical protein
MIERDEYLLLRREFEPRTVTLVIVAESPPISGKYFYKTDGKPTEPLFSAMMKQIGVNKPATKCEGLRAFQGCGWVLVDATYKQVNEPGDHRRRDLVIKEDYPCLVRDLTRLVGARRGVVPVVLIKANVCRLLEPWLKDDGFNVLNEDRVIYFPAMRWQPEFEKQFRKIVGGRA